MHVVQFVCSPVRYFVIVLNYFMIFVVVFVSDITGALCHLCFIIYCFRSALFCCITISMFLSNTTGCEGRLGFHFLSSVSVFVLFVLVQCGAYNYNRSSLIQVVISVYRTIRYMPAE